MTTRSYELRIKNGLIYNTVNITFFNDQNTPSYKQSTVFFKNLTKKNLFSVPDNSKF